MRIWDIGDLFSLFSMKPLKSGYIPDTDILALNTKFVNMFLLPTGQGYIAIDAGSNAGMTAGDLEKFGINPEDVGLLLLTHAHPDHMTGLGLFKAARICAGEHELPLLERITMHLLPEDMSLQDLELLTDGQDLQMGEHKIHCIEVPCHTPGSMMYLIDGKYLFSGDAFKVSKGQRKEHPFSMYKKLVNSSMAIADSALEDKPLVITSHYGYHDAQDLL